MFGDFETNPAEPEKDGVGAKAYDENEGRRRRRFIDEPEMDDFHDYIETGSSYFGKFREKRQNNRARSGYGGGRGATNSIPNPPTAKNLTSGR